MQRCNGVRIPQHSTRSHPEHRQRTAHTQPFPTTAHTEHRNQTARRPRPYPITGPTTTRRHHHAAHHSALTGRRQSIRAARHDDLGGHRAGNISKTRPRAAHKKDTAARARPLSAPGEDSVDEGAFVRGGWPVRPLHYLVGRASREEIRPAEGPRAGCHRDTPRARGDSALTPILYWVARGRASREEIRVRPGVPGRRRAAGGRSVPNPAVITARPAPAFETVAGPPEPPASRH